MDQHDADRMFEDFLAGRTDRRTFVTRLLLAGASATSVALLLDACGGSTAPPGGDEGELPETKELHVYNWSDYIAEDVVPAFERETGVRTTYDTYESNEELMAKLQVGGGGYDLVVPTGYVVTVLAAQGLLSPLRKELLANWGNLHPLFTNPTYDPGNRYSVPWMWGTTGIAYRSDKVTPPPDSWGVFHDERYRNEMTQMDDERDCVGAWLKFRGRSLNSTDPGELEAAKADALLAKKLLKAYVSAPVKGQLVSGDVWIAQLWNGDTMQARSENAAIAYALPKEGAGIWTDNLVIPASAPNKRNAHRFVDFVLRPEIATKNADFTGYGSPNAKATPAKPVPYPTSEELARLEYQRDLGAAITLWDQVWTEIKSA